MLTQAQLELIADRFETEAGATTAANPNTLGRWARIAAAAESLAGITSTANRTLPGYMTRTAVALESLAETDGDAENHNYNGTMKRIVDALEVLNSETYAGTLDGRFLAASADIATNLIATLGELTIDVDTIADDAEIGDVVGTLSGKTPGSSLELTDDGGGLFELVGLEIKVADVLVADEYPLEVTETRASATNSPNPSTITITVTAA